MIVSAALVRGNAARLLAHDSAGASGRAAARRLRSAGARAAARIGAAAGFAEINLNVGCPERSGQERRVRRLPDAAPRAWSPSACGACASATQLPVTVKCRIGIDARDDYEFFSRLRRRGAGAGVDALIVHARAAMLGGLTPKENREIPPLKYDYVHRLKRERPTLPVVLNGGMAESRRRWRATARRGSTASCWAARPITGRRCWRSSSSR